jgi:hypothetical protein
MAQRLQSVFAMNLRTLALASSPLVVVLAVVTSGCGAKHSSSCSKKVDLVSPFTDLGLPVDDGRVCDSDEKKTRMEFVGKDKEKWRGAIEQSVTGAGFTKESCPSYCVYTKGTQRLQVIIGDINDKWVTASLIMSTGRDKGESKSSSSDRPAKADKPSSGGSSSIDSIPECKAYFAKILACPASKGPMSRQEEADKKKEELQKKLDKGSSPTLIGKSCETLSSVQKCR